MWWLHDGGVELSIKACKAFLLLVLAGRLCVTNCGVGSGTCPSLQLRNTHILRQRRVKHLKETTFHPLKSNRNRTLQ